MNFLGIGIRDSNYFGKIRSRHLKNLKILGFGIRDSKYFGKLEVHNGCHSSPIYPSIDRGWVTLVSNLSANR